MSDVRLPRWLRVTMAFLKNWKETFGSLAILFTLYLWYFDRISQDKAIFGIVLLVSGGFINNTIDFVSIFKHLGNYKKGGQNESE